MKITVVDTNTITNGDVSLDEMNTLGEVEYFDMLSEDEIISAARDSDAIICNKADITEKIMDECKNLRYVGVFATGYNNIDLDAATKRGITVANVPGYSTDAVAQHTFAMILEFATSLSHYNASVHAGDWVKSKQFCYFSYPLSELAGKTLGIIGYGTIGAAVAKIGKAFNMKIIANARSNKIAEGVEFLPKDEIFRRSDYLTFHCPLNPETKGLVCRRTLSLMKPTAYLINTARGGICVENDLCEALKNGTISGAAIDVLDGEPMYDGHPYLTAPNMIITPHIAWAAIETRRRLITLVCDNVRAFMNGKPINKVN